MATAFDKAVKDQSVELQHNKILLLFSEYIILVIHE